MDAMAEQRVAREAAEWYLLLHSGEATEADRQACEHWRNSHESHTRAWQLAENIYQQLNVLPQQLTLTVLRRAHASNRRKFISTLTLLMISTSVGILAHQQLPWQQWTASQRSGTGQRQQISLTDGSDLLLNTRTSLDVVVRPEQRRLVLHSGEVRIETVVDPRPFFLQTPHGVVQAFGNSRFFLRHSTSHDQLAVEVGRVEIRPEIGSSQQLQDGQQTRFDRLAVRPPEPLQPASSDWVRGILRADRQRLVDFVAEVNRYRPGVIHCDPAVANLLISGVFRLDDTDRLLTAITRVLPVQLSYRTRYWVALLPA